MPEVSGGDFSYQRGYCPVVVVGVTKVKSLAALIREGSIPRREQPGGPQRGKDPQDGPGVVIPGNHHQSANDPDGQGSKKGARTGSGGDQPRAVGSRAELGCAISG